MNHELVSVNIVVVWAAWLVGATLMALDAFRIVNSWDPAFVGMPLVTFGTVRYVAGMLDGLRGRERDAFELGQESIRLVR